MSSKKAQDIRNIALLGHGGAGKTTLAEAMLHRAGATKRLGTIEDGSTVMDFTDIEKERKHSVDPAMAFFDYGGKTVNLIDAPGYPDFIGGAIAAVSGADVAVIVISAQAGIEVNTRKMFELAGREQLPRAIVINKIDAENVDLPGVLGAITETFGPAIKCANLPVENRARVIDCFTVESGESDLGDVERAHTELIESVIEADEEMTEAYLGGEEIPPEKLLRTFAKAMVSGTLIPVFFTAARQEIGVAELLDAVMKYFPSPQDLWHVTVRTGREDDAQTIELTPSPDKPLIAQAIRISADPFVGKLSWVRILQGTISGETAFYLRDERKSIKASHVLKALGGETQEVDSAGAGDIVVLAKVEEIRTGDILHSEPKAMFGTYPTAPTPMYSRAVKPKSRGDEGKISEALSRLAEEDPTFRVARNTQTNETIISGMGDLHLRIMLQKMSSRFGLEVDTTVPKIPYRETISIKADGHYRHKKQTGGAGQFGEVFLRVEPLDRDTGFEFTEELFGESIPRQFLPAIEKGIREVVESGAIAGYPMQDIKVTITDGKHHPVDSKEVAFRAAGKYAFLDAVNKAKPILLEPIVNMEITVPNQYMGDIAGDISGRRGRILGQDVLPGNLVVIKAQVPLAEVAQYNSQLRSVTGGQGSFTMEFSHYEPVPANIQQQIIAKAQKEKEQAG